MSIKYIGKELEVVALSAFVALARASESVSKATSIDLEEHGLTGSQFGVLEALYHLGDMCQKDLAKKILKSGGNMTTVLGNLEKRNLVKRVRDEEDSRKVVVGLSTEGRDLIAKIFPSHARLIGVVMSELDSSEQNLLIQLCKKLGLAVQRKHLDFKGD